MIMNDQPHESIEFSDQDVEDLRSMGVTDGEVPEFHPLLEVWKEVLSNLPKQIDERITPQFAMRICQTYPQLIFADMPLLRDMWHERMEAFRQVLLEVIESDEDCLQPTTPEEDVEQNSKHYRTLLLEWQKLLLTWEMEWDTTSPTAAVEIAATAEVHKFFFSESGLTRHLEMIQFQYTEADQAEVQLALRAMTEGGDGE